MSNYNHTYYRLNYMYKERMRNFFDNAFFGLTDYKIQVNELSNT